eukprot:8063341-Alexandrium_andersonii.AAC.1
MCCCGLATYKIRKLCTGTHARINADTPPRASCLQHDRLAAQFRAASTRGEGHTKMKFNRPWSPFTSEHVHWDWHPMLRESLHARNRRVISPTCQTPCAAA